MIGIVSDKPINENMRAYMVRRMERKLENKLDTIWEWLGFKQKVNAKTLLEKLFIIDIDYTSLLLLQQKQVNGKKHGGHNIQKIIFKE